MKITEIFKKLIEFDHGSKMKKWALDNKAQQIVRMSIDEFLQLTTQDQESIHRIGKEAQSKEFYQDLMNQGQITVPPFLDIDQSSGKVRSHEGRHRAFALKKSGETDIDVAVVLVPRDRKWKMSDIPSTISNEYGSGYSTQSAKWTVLADDIQKVLFESVIDLDQLVKSFQESDVFKKNNLGKRDNCGVAALEFIDYAKDNGINGVTRVEGTFRAQKPSLGIKDFTKGELKQMQIQGFDPSSLASRTTFAKKNGLINDLKQIPHYWNEFNGKIIDTVGHKQFIDTGLSPDLSTNRYESKHKEQITEGIKETAQIMFPAVLLKYEPDIKTKYIDWALQTLKREDRVVWYLRLARLYITKSLASLDVEDIGGNISEDELNELKRLRDKYVADVAKRFRTSPTQIMNNTDSWLKWMPIAFKGNLEHFMALNSVEVQNIVWGDQTPQEMRDQLEEAEKIWKDKQHGMVPFDDGIELFLDCGNNWAWYDLNRTGCDVEGKAMGHCGNAGSRNSYETILSLREKTKGGFRPALTFILDTKTGLLGEMKGRGNDKPAARYHPMIIKLLRDERIEGISGGGYMPKNNFSMDDLPEDTRGQLLEEKPELGGLEFNFKKNGFDKTTKNLLRVMIESRFPVVCPDLDESPITIEEFSSMREFLGTISSHAASVQRYLDGDDFFDVDTVGDVEVESFINNNFTGNEIDKIVKSAKDYGEITQEQIDSDGFNAAEVLARETDFAEEVREAERIGRESGMFTEMKNAIDGFITDLESDWSRRIGRLNITKDHKDRIIIKVDHEWLVNFCVEYQDDIESGYNSWLKNIENNLYTSSFSEPYNGFDGYDKDVAMDHLRENSRYY